MMLLPAEGVKLAQRVVFLIARKQWQELVTLGACDTVNSADIERVLSEYDLDLTEHPEGKLESSMDVYPTHDPNVWLVDLALWGTEGPSDLTLKLRITRKRDSLFEILIGDLRVL